MSQSKENLSLINSRKGHRVNILTGVFVPSFGRSFPWENHGRGCIAQVDEGELELPHATIISFPYPLPRMDYVQSQNRGRKTKNNEQFVVVGALWDDTKKWKVDFEADREPQNVQKVREILPGLPMMFWKKEILEAIGGKIGKFIVPEENWEQKVDKRYATG